MNIPIDTNKYWIREDGSIIGVRYNKDIARTTIGKSGYYMVKVSCVDGKYHSKNVHRIIAEHLIPNPHELRTVNHIDGNKLNNNVSNLEWMTTKDNCIHYTSATEKWEEKARNKLHSDSVYVNLERINNRSFLEYHCRVCSAINVSRLDSTIITRGLCKPCSKLKNKGDSSARY